MSQKTQPVSPCALCRNESVLCDSHLLPAASYKPLRSASNPSPHPLVLTPDKAYHTSKQPKDYVLCRDCEERFHRNGEDWILSHYYRGRNKGFRFREILQQQAPVFEDGDSKIYACANVPGLDMDQVIYFAMSVFWRTAVHVWRRDKRVIHIELGKYEEPLRMFLLGAGPFPEKMALQVWVSSLQGDMLANSHLTEETRVEQHRAYGFAIPGMVFRLIVSGNLPQRFVNGSTAPSPEKFVAIIPRHDWQDIFDMARRLQKLRPATGR
jgi:hypothetical protein